MGTMALGLAEARANREGKDSLFCDLFSDKRYLLRLYRDLHPEDADIAEDDIDLVTLDRVLTRGQYNDLGFVARDRIVVLVEAQSTWTPNISVRMLFYLVDTYRRWIATRKYNVYRVAPIELPVPEFYVVYTGRKKDVPNEISFATEIVGDSSSSVEVKVGVLHGEGGVESEGILAEYLAFAQMFDAKREEFGRSLEAIDATIDACIESGILREYLQSRREEVVAMMTGLLDREEAMAAYREEIEEEARRSGIEKGIEQGIEKGIEKGIEQGIEGLAAKLRACGVDDALIDEAIAAYRSENARGA